MFLRKIMDFVLIRLSLLFSCSSEAVDIGGIAGGVNNGLYFIVEESAAGR
jgi:hypothetical protein